MPAIGTTIRPVRAAVPVRTGRIRRDRAVAPVPRPIAPGGIARSRTVRGGIDRATTIRPARSAAPARTGRTRRDRAAAPVLHPIGVGTAGVIADGEYGRARRSHAGP